MTTKTPAMLLQELSIKKAKSPPVYSLIYQEQGTHDNKFIYQVRAMGITATGQGRSKKEAKQETARNALSVLAYEKEFQEEIPSEYQITNDDIDLKGGVNYKGDLGDICLQHNIPPPTYVEISAVGPPHAMEFTYECRINDSLTTRATANTKKLAKQTVAKEMLDRLKNIVILPGEENDNLQLCDEETIQPEILAAYKSSVLRETDLGRIVVQNHSYLRNIIKERQIDVEDLLLCLESPFNEEKLQKFVDHLEYGYEIVELPTENNLTTVAINILGNTPLTSLGQAIDKETAKKEALDCLSDTLSNFIQE